MMRYSIYLLAIICFGVSGCAAGPRTYQEIDQAAFDATEAYINYDDRAENELTLMQTVKAMNKARKRLASFELNVLRAEVLFAQKAMCEVSSEDMWYCPRGQPRRKPRGDEPLHMYVKRYKSERDAQCVCANSDEVMNAIGDLF